MANIDPIDLEKKETGTRLRPIIIKLVRYIVRNAIFKIKKILKGKTVSIAKNLIKKRIIEMKKAWETYSFKRIFWKISKETNEYRTHQKNYEIINSFFKNIKPKPNVFTVAYVYSCSFWRANIRTLKLFKNLINLISNHFFQKIPQFTQLWVIAAKVDLVFLNPF